MLSDEEKQAIEYLKSRLYGNECCKFIDVAQSDLRIFLKLVEKQQKEIEELKKYEEGYKLLSYSLENYICKDKIKAKIEELEKQDRESRMSHNYLVIPILQSLLEKE